MTRVVEAPGSPIDNVPMIRKSTMPPPALTASPDVVNQPATSEITGAKNTTVPTSPTLEGSVNQPLTSLFSSSTLETVRHATQTAHAAAGMPSSRPPLPMVPSFAPVVVASERQHVASTSSGPVDLLKAQQLNIDHVMICLVPPVLTDSSLEAIVAMFGATGGGNTNDAAASPTVAVGGGTSNLGLPPTAPKAQHSSGKYGSFHGVPVGFPALRNLVFLVARKVHQSRTSKVMHFARDLASVSCDSRSDTSSHSMMGSATTGNWLDSVSGAIDFTSSRRCVEAARVWVTCFHQVLTSEDASTRLEHVPDRTAGSFVSTPSFQLNNDDGLDMAIPRHAAVPSPTSMATPRLFTDVKRQMRLGRLHESHRFLKVAAETTAAYMTYRTAVLAVNGAQRGQCTAASQIAALVSHSRAWSARQSQPPANSAVVTFPPPQHPTTHFGSSLSVAGGAAAASGGGMVERFASSSQSNWTLSSGSPSVGDVASMLQASGSGSEFLREGGAKNRSAGNGKAAGRVPILDSSDVSASTLALMLDSATGADGAGIDDVDDVLPYDDDDENPDLLLDEGEEEEEEDPNLHDTADGAQRGSGNGETGDAAETSAEGVDPNGAEYGPTNRRTNGKNRREPQSRRRSPADDAVPNARVVDHAAKWWKQLAFAVARIALD